MEIKPIPPRLRQMINSPPESDSEIIMVGAHIVRSVDPFPHLKAHQASCDGKRRILGNIKRAIK